jgi:hypothetical protein
MSNSAALFKTKFGKLSENAYNSANYLLGTCKKTYNFVGDEMKEATPTQFAGGVGSGSLPTPNPASAVKATITSKKVYATTQIEREAIKASMTSEGAFVQGLKWVAQKTVESWNRNASRIMFSDGTGSLGQFSGNASGTATNPVITVTAGTWVEGYWEENDYVNVNVLSSVWEVTAVNPSTKAITLERISGSDDLTTIGAGTHTVYMQNSRNNDPIGLKGICDAVVGSDSLYGVLTNRRWSATNIQAGGQGISEDALNEIVMRIQYKTGKAPKALVTSYTQLRKIKNFLEDHKIYEVEPRSNDLKGKISFKGVSYLSDAGEIGIFADRMCDDDRLYAVNTDFIEGRHRPDFGWFDDDGTVFLRLADDDAYGARYGGYYQNYIIPSFQGVIDGLAI